MKKSYLIVYLIVYALSFAVLYSKHLTHLSDFRYGIVVLILIGTLFYSETLARNRRLNNWGEIRLQGKARFILMDYVVLRGGIISLLILLLLSTKVTIGLIILASVVPLLAAIAFVANEEWKYCEEQYVISTLKSMAENIKAIQN
jgi:hypothetical protein